MQISTKTTWSTVWTTAGFRRRYRNPPRRLRVRTRTAGRRRRLSCWCVTGRVRDNKAAGTKRHSRSWKVLIDRLSFKNGSSALTFDLCAPRRFGNPFILYLERTVTWDVLQKEILEKMRHLLRPGVLVQVFAFLCPWAKHTERKSSQRQSKASAFVGLSRNYRKNIRKKMGHSPLRKMRLAFRSLAIVGRNPNLGWAGVGVGSGWQWKKICDWCWV